MSVVPGSVVLLSSSDVDRLLDLPACITAVEAAFRSRGSGVDQPGGVLGVHLEHGGYHVKAASLGRDSRYFAAKLNANYPTNSRAGLPTIQGLVLLSDAVTGTPLAVMESGTLTRLRTAATSAVAARHLANHGAATLAVIGCGAQAQPHIEAFSAVRPLERVTLFDDRTEVATTLARRLGDAHPFPVVVSTTLDSACTGASMIVTCTTARDPFLHAGMLAPGTFIAAVGADAPDKQEVDANLLAASALVTDETMQCAQIGELHHAIESGAMKTAQVRAELGAVVAGQRPGRLDAEEIVIFDSTGIPIEDVAAAGIIYERAVDTGIGGRFAFRH